MKILLPYYRHFPVDKVQSMGQSNTYRRYERQIVLKEFGTAAQEKLFHAKVLVVGAGGLGCPALQYLTAAGIGYIGIVDFDKVELSNLQRQVLFAVDDIGKPKAIVAAEKLKLFNPEIQFSVFEKKLGTANALDIIVGFDVVIDGTDNFATRYLMNDACVLLGKPLIYGAVLRFEGQVGVFNFPERDGTPGTNYRDLFPQPPDPATVPSCNEAGVLGILPGIIGTMQAAEAIKIITGIGRPLCNTIVSYNMLDNIYYECMVSPADNNDINFPKSKEAFESFNYEWFCGITQLPNEISTEEFDELLKKEKLNIIDVRETDELPVIHEFPCSRIPLSRFDESISAIGSKEKIVFICKSGKRSLSALKLLNEKYPDCRAYSLKGGLDEWKLKIHLKK